MIGLHLAIGSGDIPLLEFDNKIELLEYLSELKVFDCVWLLAVEGLCSDILITEKLETLIKYIEVDFFDLYKEEYVQIFIQEYQNYKDAYSVAYDMREGNPKQ